MTDRAGPPVSYPPEHHVLRDLPFDTEAVDERASRAHLEVTPELLTAGRLGAGPLMTVVDVLAGSLVGRVVAPDWMATAQLSVPLAGPPAGGRVVVDATVVRDGRTTVVMDAKLRTDPDDGASRRFGDAMLTFVRLPRRDTNFDMSAFEVRYGERASFSLPGSGLHRPYATALGVEVVDATTGSVRLDVGPYVLNSFGAVNGGVVASIAAEAATALASTLGSGPVRVADAVVHYLTQGRVGPVVTEAEVVRIDAVGALVRVEVCDAGALEDGRPRTMVVAHVHCTA